MNDNSGKLWTIGETDIDRWLNSVIVGGADTVAADAHIVVRAIPGEKGAPPELKLDGLPPKLVEAINDGVGRLGWRGADGNLHLIADGHPIVVVAASTTKTSRLQLDRKFGQDVAQALKGLKVKTLQIVADSELSCAATLEGLAGGFYDLGLCRGQAAEETDDVKFPAKVKFLGAKYNAAQWEDALEMCRSLVFTRNLQDAPANIANPEMLADTALELGKQKGVTCKVFGPKEMRDLGMGAFLSVADGSEVEPRFIVIEIDGEDSSRTVALVGKGVTFDAGGISLKPSASMDEMKYDMSGAAAVLGAARYFAHNKPPCRVICLVGATENLPSGKATKPGDIVKAMNGKTIEVLNTDAEGRLVLADVLAYAVKNYKPDLMIDAATLTGAVLFALGSAGSAVVTNNDKVAAYVLDAASEAGEPLWQLPIWPELTKEVKGDVGDLKNIAKPTVKAGSSMGGAFLAEFVEETAWAHLDIAGTAWSCQATGYPDKGGSAFGVRTLIACCRRLSGASLS